MSLDKTSTEDSSSSEDYSSESSDEDGMEPVQVGGVTMQLPQGLCEREDIFGEFFTVELWNSFSDEDKQNLQTLLPNFPGDDDVEKTKTLQRLFDFDNFNFGNPLTKFHKNLKAGYYRPDIARMRKVIQKSEKNEAKYRYKTFRDCLLSEIQESQSKLLNQVKTLPPGVEPRQEKRKVSVDLVSQRTRKRYFQILASIQAKTDDTDISSDENYPDGPPPGLSRKQKRHLNSIRNALNNSSNKDKMFDSTMTPKLNGICIDFEKHIVPHHNPFYINDDSYKYLLVQHRKRKYECPDDPELNVRDITISDVIARTQLPFIKNLCLKSSIQDLKGSKRKIKKELSIPTARKSPESNFTPLRNLSFVSNMSSNSDSDSDSLIDAVTVPQVPTKKPKLIAKSLTVPNTSLVKTKTPPVVKKIEKEATHPTAITKSATVLATNAVTNTNSTATFKPITPHYSTLTPIKIEDLETIDIMNTPIELDNSDIDIMHFNVKPELMQETHACFFSLIRDVICSTDNHRMNMYTLQERLKAWQENPISPLNDWYSYVDNWISILPSAITFLCGNASDQPEEFVPYMEYKTTLDVYQWIGAGRDGDQLMMQLCNFWLEHRTECKAVTPTTELELLEGDRTPPPPRCPTNWTVRKATSEAILDYQEQERRRYDNPHRAFTYRCNGFESVVGPLKGIYNPATTNTKARGHTMLSADRPNFVTILSLVRDACARLPNGEGTRGEICELLKSSQYIASDAPDNILQSVVSGALDRMHTQWDPCVKYEPKRKIWIYLHRNRTEEDFERIHQQYQGMPKSKKPPRKSPAKPKTPKTEQQTSRLTKAAKMVQQQKQIVAQQQQKQVTEQQPVVELQPAQVIESITQPLPSPILSAETATNPTPVTPQPKPKTQRQQSLLQQQQTKVNVVVEEKLPATVPVAMPSLVPTSIPPQQKGASLLLCNNLPKVQQMQQTEIQPDAAMTNSKSLIKPQYKMDNPDPDLKEALQIRVASPNTLKSIPKGQMMKIVSPSQGKSLIIPTSNPQIIKQIQERPPKQVTQVVTQQFFQSVTPQQKQMLLQKVSNSSVKSSMELPNPETMKQIEKSKVPVSIQQQIIQSIAPQQLQNMKNITLLRANNSGQSVSLTPVNVTTTQIAESQQNLQNIVTVAVSKQGFHNEGGSQGVQIKTPGNLTAAQTQQILQTIKQKYLPNANILTQPQQVVVKPKGPNLVQVQNKGPNMKTNIDTSSKTTSSSPGPVVAKVLTNAAGQVISVESLLAHHKTQGTTLRVQGSKSGQQNIIHLTGNANKSAPIAQFAVNSQNNLVALTSQPKLVMATHTTAITSTVTTTKSRNALTRAQQMSKIPNKVAQQLINAKVIAPEQGQQVVQSKLVMKQGGAVHPVKIGKASSKGINISTGAQAIRMVNAANLNLTTIDGKPVLLASKAGTIQNVHGQNVILQAQPSASNPGSLVIQSSPSGKGALSTAQTTASLNTANLNVINAGGNLVFQPHIKNQVAQQVLFTSSAKGTVGSPGSSTQATTAQSIAQGHLVLGGQPIRLQSSGSAGTAGQRVVLASQGQGGQIVAQQILLPAGFQGTAINIKALQGVKVIPIAQAQGKGNQTRQVFARVMSPSLVKQSGPSSSTGKNQDNVTVHSPNSE